MKLILIFQGEGRNDQLSNMAALIIKGCEDFGFMIRVLHFISFKIVIRCYLSTY